MTVLDALNFLGGLLGGGVLLKLMQTWLLHSQKSAGSFRERTQAARVDFGLVVKHLEDRIEHLENSEAECRERNRQLDKRNRELEEKVRKLEKRIEEMILMSPWRDPVTEMPQPT